jgi:hypothetical protein
MEEEAGDLLMKPKDYIEDLEIDSNRKKTVKNRERVSSHIPTQTSNVVVTHEAEPQPNFFQRCIGYKAQGRLDQVNPAPLQAFATEESNKETDPLATI